MTPMPGVFECDSGHIGILTGPQITHLLIITLKFSLNYRFSLNCLKFTTWIVIDNCQYFGMHKILSFG